MQLKRILVAVAGTSVDPDVIRLAVALAKPAKAEVIAVHVIEVRWNLALDAVLEPELDHGEELLADAAKLAEQAGLRIETDVLLGMPYRTRLGRVHVGKTVQNVYVGAPCAVLAYRQEAPQ